MDKTSMSKSRQTDGGYFTGPSLTSQVNKIMHVKIFHGISNYTYENLISINIFFWNYESGNQKKIGCDFLESVCVPEVLAKSAILS